MSNEIVFVIIAIVAITGLTVLFYFAKKRTTPPKEPDNSLHKIPEARVEQPQSPVALPLQEEVKPESKPIEELLDTITDRRKCDKTIPKRPVPNIGTITKEKFSDFAGERILVAEDNPINQKVIVGLLAGSGIEVILANDGQEVLDILENDSNFLMILMDAHMPRVDGFEATRIIRADSRFDHILVVALSGDVGADDIYKMESVGMAEQLAKPLRMESLYKIFYAYTSQVTQQEAASSNILDIEEGLQICGGDESFYREILSEFVDDYGDSAEKLGVLLRAHDVVAADALLLDIIGVAANIGASKLGEKASALKMALSDTDEKSYFSLYDRYKVQLNRVIEDIRGYNSSQPLL